SCATPAGPPSASRPRPAAPWAARSAPPARPVSSATSAPARSSSRWPGPSTPARPGSATSSSWGWASRWPTTTPPGRRWSASTTRRPRPTPWPGACGASRRRPTSTSSPSTPRRGSPPRPARPGGWRPSPNGSGPAASTPPSAATGAPRSTPPAASSGRAVMLGASGAPARPPPGSSVAWGCAPRRPCPVTAAIVTGVLLSQWGNDEEDPTVAGQQRFFDPSQPQTLQIATVLLYFQAFFALVSPFGVALPFALAYAAGGFGIANGKQW